MLTYLLQLSLACLCIAMATVLRATGFPLPPGSCEGQGQTKAVCASHRGYTWSITTKKNMLQSLLQLICTGLCSFSPA